MGEREREELQVLHSQRNSAQYTTAQHSRRQHSRTLHYTVLHSTAQQGLNNDKQHTAQHIPHLTQHITYHPLQTTHSPILRESLQGLREGGAQVVYHVSVDLVVDTVVNHVSLRTLLVHYSGVWVGFLQQLHDSYSRVLSWRVE